MKNFIYVIVVALMLGACGDSDGKKASSGGNGGNGGTVLNHQHYVCNELLPSQLAVSQYNTIDPSIVNHDRFYDSRGQSYIYRTNNSQFGNQQQGQLGNQQQGHFINAYTRETVSCNRLYAIDTYIEFEYNIPRVCADYRLNINAGRYEHKYASNSYVSYDNQRGGYYLPDNTVLNCRFSYQGQQYQDQLYYGLFYSYQASSQTGYYRNYNFQTGGSGSLKDILKGAVIFGVGAAIINAINK